MPPALRELSAVQTEDMYIVIPGLDWDRYHAITAALGDRPALKTVFLDGRLTLLSPSRRHDWQAKALAFLVEAVADGLRIESETGGHATYRRRDAAVGVEGDDTFYFRANAERMRGPVDVDLDSQPPPDLAIEVEVTHPATDALQSWSRLGVPEVWVFNERRGTLTFGVLQGDGTYAPAECSPNLAPLRPGDVLAQMKLAEDLGRTRWRAQLPGWVHESILPRLDETT